MNPLRNLERKIQDRFPTARTALDAAETPAGSSFLDISLNGPPVVVEWRLDQGFGVAARRDGGFGEGADECFDSVAAAFSRIERLLSSAEATNPPESVRLRELRARRGLSQEDLARALGVRQAAVSKFENRNDVLVSTLAEVIRALGGELRITARFLDGERDLRISDAQFPVDRATNRTERARVSKATAKPKPVRRSTKRQPKDASK